MPSNPVLKLLQTLKDSAREFLITVKRENAEFLQPLIGKAWVSF
jgi:hypothetical protein